MKEPIMGARARMGFDRRTFLAAFAAGLGATSASLSATKNAYADGGNSDAASAQGGFTVSGRKAILYDASKCVGCHYCEMACKNANSLAGEVQLNVRALAGTCIPMELFPPSMLSAAVPEPIAEDDRTAERWLRVLATPITSEEGKSYVYARHSCTHCGKCAAVCPSGALKQRADGVVTVEPERCIGCKYCYQACPYDIPRFKEGAEDRAMRKCTMCSSRIDEDKLPACVDACPAGALSYGSWEAVRAEAEKARDALIAAGHADARLHAEDTALVSVLV